MAQPLLRTKFFPPPARQDVHPRPALVQRLQSALKHKLTLISAPAGFGKTTTAALWLAAWQIPAAWLSLDESDNDAGMFLAYVTAAVENLMAERDGGQMDAAPGKPEDSAATLTALINQISRFEEPLIMVLEDYHLIQDQAVHRVVMFLLDHLPPNFHLVILTRSDPPFPLSRMRGRGEIFELRTADLRFSPREVRSYLEDILHLTLSNDQIQVLVQRTEGWIAGLQMAGLSLQGRSELETIQFVDNLASHQAFVLDYLADEVLHFQPEPVQEFLLQTCILEHLTGELCDALTGKPGGGELLKRLQADNMFLFPLDQDDRWYRYHLLFAELLRNRLRKRGQAALAELHRRASGWYMQQGMFADAISHALAGADYERAVALLETHALAVIFRGEFTRVWLWLQSIPEEVLYARPLLCIALAWASVQPENLVRAEALIQRAEAAVESPDTGQKLREKVSAHAATLRAVIARARDEAPEMQMALTRQALLAAPAEDQSLHSVLALRLGLSFLDRGDESEAGRQFDQAITLGRESENHYALATASYCQTMITLRRGSLFEAAALCRNSIRSGRMPQGGRPLPVNGMPYVMLGTIYLEWNDLENAGHFLQEGLALLDAAGIYQDAELKLKGHYALARLQMARGEFTSLPDLNEIGKQGKPFLRTLAAALQTTLEIRGAAHRPDCEALLRKASAWAELHLVEPKENLYWDWEMLKDFAYLRVRLAQQRAAGGAFPDEDLNQLLRRLSGTSATAGQRGWMGMVMEACLLEALIWQVNGEIEKALQALGRALKTAASAGYRRVFLDEGDPLVHLLYKAVEMKIEPEYAARLLGLIAPVEAVSQPVLGAFVEPLTRREVDVLRLLAEGLSNKEIGQRLSISLGTVKRHTANINGKLGVNNRTQAVVQAQKLGILGG